MKKSLVLFSAGIAALSFFMLAGCAAQKKEWGYHVLKINGNYVDDSIFMDEYGRYYENNKRNALALRKPENERRAEMLESVIERELAESFITNGRNITISDQEVMDFLNRYVKPSLYSDLEGEEPIPLDYRDVPVNQKTFRAIRPYLARVKIIAELARKYNITFDPKEVEREYQRQIKDNRLVIGRHITLPAGQMPLALELAGKLKRGADMAELVKKYSIDADAKTMGGVMGNIAGAKITPDFEKKLQNVKTGDIIRPFQTGYGIEIIRVENMTNFNHPREDIEKDFLMWNFYKSPAYHEWVSTLIAGNKIEILNPALKAYYLYKTGSYAEAAPLFVRLFQSSKSREGLDMVISSFMKAGNGEEAVRWSVEGQKVFPGFKLNYYLSQASGFMLMGKTNESLSAMKKAEMESGGQFIKDVADRYFELGFTNEGTAYSKIQ